jgi:ketosteroid isomerase-like protein
MPDNELTAQEKTDLRHHFDGFMEILNSKDAKKIAAKFDKDAVFVGAAGISVGRDAIQKRFAHNFERRFKGATMKLTNLEPLAKIGAGLVAGGGSCLAGNILKETGDPVQPLKSNLVMTLVNRNGEWLFHTLAIVNETAHGH